MEKENIEFIQQAQDKFKEIISQIPLSYINYLSENKEEADGIAQNMEISLVSISLAAAQLKTNNCTLEQFKEVLFKIIARETEQLEIGREENGEMKIVSDDEINKLSSYCLSHLSDIETKRFAKYLYESIFAFTRSACFTIKEKASILILGRNMQSTKLTIFDEDIKNYIENHKNEQANNKKIKK